MTAPLQLAHDTFVLVCDGRKALILRNAGDRKYPNLVVERTLEAAPNPPTHEHGTDGPGRLQARHSPRSAVETSDAHRFAEDAFITETAETVNKLTGDRVIERLVVVAPPRALGVLRTTLDAASRKRMVAEIDKDLVRRPVYEIERLLTQ